ncbi:expressed unknown protein [Seminavis robusta]|uniref:Uncharacterized protein n=1 Tax=Seminavis robusta TaxID=568900 RepID=A0A9N8DPY5_9STRA|nr:expressed unknown protein [Seminavis robusta]|eukprot:Sro287_g108680.1 n/a (1018) ;mRNA; f:66762-69994
MSDSGYSVDSLGVKSKIASFEAFNETVRNTDSPERRSNTGSVASQGSVASSKVSKKKAHRPVDPEPSREHSATGVASQSRKSRLQRALNEKQRPEPGSLMQKRQNAKGRRLASIQQQQQQQTRQASSASADNASFAEPRQEQQQPSSRHGNSRSQQLSPTKGLTSPSSLSQTRSPNRRQTQQPPPGNKQKNSNLTLSPNMMVATAAARQHRASNYASNYSQQQQQLSFSSSGEQDASVATGRSSKASKTSKGTMSRFHKLKMKGMDHAKLAQKRKQAVQNSNRFNNNNNSNRSERTQQQDASTPKEPNAASPVRNQRSPRHQPEAMPANQQSPRQHQQQTMPAQAQGSPDQPLTDDDATLTSVARLFEQPNDPSSQQQQFVVEQTPTNQTPSSVSQTPAGKPPLLWSAGGEEKSDKAAEFSHVSSANHNNSVGIYPRPSSSSEFEPEVSPHHLPMNSHNPYAMPKSSSPQHSLRQHQQPYHQHFQQQQPYHHHQSPQPYGGNYTPNRSPSQQQQQYQQQYSPPQAPMMSSHDPGGNGGLMRRSAGSYASQNGHQHFYQSSSTTRLDDDDRTFDYGVRDDDSQGSTTFQQQLLEAERKAREQSHISENNTVSNMSQQTDSVSRRHGKGLRDTTSPLLKTEEPMDQYRQSLESPAMKTAAGVIGAATVGCIVIGPVGMLLGAAAVGIGVGVMQIPEEQRSNMADKATEALTKVQKQALDASEVLSNSCATTYKDSGIADHIPAEMTQFCAVSEDHVDPVDVISPDIKSQDSEAGRIDQVTGPCGGGVVGVGGGDLPRLKNHHDSRKPASPNQSRSLRNKKVACLRHVRIVPVSEIHGMDPVLQPRAWLDVLASADTSDDEKSEAMEEILILAKDKQRARIFLEEGILDSIMWILSRYFEKVNRKSSDDHWAHPEITVQEKNMAKLASTCCVTLGKAHCAAIHTEGDLLLMSLYERGTVPEERQLAQMLYEVPHHTRVTKTNDPTIVDPSMEVFALKQLTLPQAEDLAKSVKELADGKVI